MEMHQDRARHPNYAGIPNPNNHVQHTQFNVEHKNLQKSSNLPP